MLLLAQRQQLESIQCLAPACLAMSRKPLGMLSIIQQEPPLFMVRCLVRWTRSRHRPYHCIRHHAWLSEGLTSPLMDHEVVCQGWGYENKGWMVLLEFLRQEKVRHIRA